MAIGRMVKGMELERFSYKIQIQSSGNGKKMCLCGRDDIY